MQYKNILMLIVLFTLFLSCQTKEEKESLAIGKEVYIANCISCHGENGEGIQGIYPSLIKPNTIVEVQTQRAIGLIKNGSGFDGGMKPVALSPKEITAVLNYIQNSWGNKAPFLTHPQTETTIN